MGPLTALALFKQFEDAPESLKYMAAPAATVVVTDVLAELECRTDECADLQDRKDAAQYMLDTMAPYLR